MDIRNILKHLDELFPGAYKTISVDFRHDRKGNPELEWSLYITNVANEEFKDFTSMIKFIDALEDSLKSRNYNPLAVSDAVAEAEKIISESVSS
jgi:hypothetical protein